MKARIKNKEYTIVKKSGTPLTFNVNDAAVIIDAIETGKNVMHLLYNLHSYNIELISYNEDEKVATVKLNENMYEVVLKNETDELIEKMGIGKHTHKIQQVKAPMPGKVVEIKVKEGDMVNKGDSLLVLEAMKMENILKAAETAKVKKVHAIKGKAVEKSEVLIEME